MSKVIYTATSKAHPDEKDQSDHYFASVDGERWLEMNRLAEAEDYDEVAAKFGHIPRPDGGFGFHIALHVNYLRVWANQCVFHDPIEVA